MRVLVTGARDWADEAAVWRALDEVTGGQPQRWTVVHGTAYGADSMADRWARTHGARAEPWPAAAFHSPPQRNQRMVEASVAHGGTQVCLSFALTWASGSGQTARMARRAGIEVRDYGVDTRQEARP